MAAHILLIVIVVLLGCAGLINLAWMWIRRGSPAEARGFLFAGSACIFLAAALWALGVRAYFAAAAALIVGVVSGGLWFYHVFRQSLHNTTM